MKITNEDEVMTFEENVVREFSSLDGEKFKNFPWEIFYESLEEGDFGIILVLLEEREILLQRIRISNIEGMLKGNDRELRYKLTIAISNKVLKLRKLRTLIRECKRLEDESK